MGNTEPRPYWRHLTDQQLIVARVEYANSADPDLQQLAADIWDDLGRRAQVSNRPVAVGVGKDPAAAGTYSDAEVAATAVTPGTTSHRVAPACSPITSPGVSPDGRGCFPVV